MKALKKFLLVFVAVFSLFAFVSCGISEGYADKINKAAENDDHITYSEVIKKLDEPQINTIISIADNHNGAGTWIKGCDSLEEAKEKYDEGKTVYMLVITFMNNKATSATWSEWTPE